MWIRTIISALVLLLPSVATIGQGLLPSVPGQESLYNVRIELPRGGMTGVCMMVCDSTGLHGSVLNEFGVGLMSFSYDFSKDKVHLHSVFAKMDKYFIRRTLRRDLCKLIHAMNEGNTSYENIRRAMKYTFTPINDDDTVR